MSVYSIDVGGVERDALMDSLRASWVANGIGKLSIDLDSLTASYRPAIDNVCLLKRNGTAIWGGVLTQAPEEAFGGPALDAIVTKIAASSFEIFATYRLVTATIPAGTLKAALQVLAPYLSTHGVTLDPAQATGPTLPDLTFTRLRLDKCLAQLTVLTGYTYLWEITAANLYLRMYQPTAAPFDILDTGAVHQVGDVIIERTVNELYANKAVLTVSGSGPATSVETFVAADGVSSGGFTRFTAKYPASQSIFDVYPNQLRFNGVPVSAIGFGAAQLGPIDWFWDYTVSPAQLVYPETGLRPFPTGAEVIDIEYAIRYPFDVTGNNFTEQGARGIIERLLTVDQAMPMTTAQAYADAFVANSSREIVKGKYATWDDGLRPGMSQTVRQAKRNVDSPFILLEVNASVEPNSDASFLRYAVTAIEGANLESDWRQVLKDWLGGGTSGGGGVATTGATAPPGGTLYTAVLRLSDAQFKAAADTLTLIVQVPGAGGSPTSGHRIKPIAASVRVKTDDGAYTNIDPSARFHLVCNGRRMSTGWYNDPAVPIARFDELFGQIHDKVGDVPVPAMDTINGPLGSPMAEQFYIMGEDIASMADLVDVDDASLYLLLDNGGAGPFTGGGPLNGVKLIVYYVVEDITIVTTAPVSSCSVTLGSDDFESGAALSADYIDLGGGITKTAGVGVGGSKGVDSNGTFLAEFCKTFAPGSRNGCITFHIKASAALHAGDGGGSGSYHIEVHDPTGPNGLTAFGLSSGGAQEAGTDFGDLFIYDESFTKLGSHANEALVDAVYADVRVEFELSSLIGATPQADAWIKVYVDDVLVIDLSGLTISTYHAVNNPNNYWGGVRLAPQGHGDNLLVRN